MRIHAFTTTALTAVLAAVFGAVFGAVFAVLFAVALPGSAVAAVARPAATVEHVAGVDDDDTTRPTVNEFFPEDRPLGDCLSSLPKPNCGSEARGGWAQTAVFALIVVGLAFIAWRIFAGARRARRSAGAAAGPVRRGTPDATTARGGDGGVPAP